MKEGTILLIGRPNVGKSTFLNSLVGHKVAITSPKPQTTRFPIKALYEEERGIILFTDTPGIFGKAEDHLSQMINEKTLQTVKGNVDIVIYMIDHTRRRDFEESKVLGIVRKLQGPKKILVINKIDIQDKTYLPQYKFLEDEFPLIYEISALENKHMKPLLDKIFELLPESTDKKHNLIDNPPLNMDSRTFLAELIREKVFLKMGEEIPYTSTVIVDEVKERSKDLTYIKARILTTSDRYKRMLIGQEGRRIKELGGMARKEMALVTGKKIFLDLTVETDSHWQELYYS